MKILIAEDDLDLAEVLTAFLEKSQYTVDTVNDGSAVLEYLLSEEYDAIILDVMMPRRNGFEVLKVLRNRGDTTPVMLLTAKAEKEDRIHGFDCGADDYLPKPFDTDELLARLRAILRRRGEYRSERLEFGDLVLDRNAGTVQCKKKDLRLSSREQQVLQLFMYDPKVIFSAERIMERIWGWNSDAEINVVWVHISNLRKKLKAAGSSVTIRANRGVGYCLEDTNAT